MNEEVKGKKSPQLRFSGFKKIENEKLKDENWFSAPASEIFISVNDRNHPELPVLSASQELGMIYRDEGGMNIFHDVANEITYKRVRPGQFVIHLRSFQGGFAHSKVEGITSPAYTILDFKDRNKHNDLFWKYVLTSEEFIKRLELITYGIRDGRSINFSDFSTLKFHFPSYEVQQKIGAFLSHVDSLIQAKTQKLESLKSIKKSLLQKCFPKNGEKIPQMRFHGFTEEWEERKILDECTIKARIGWQGLKKEEYLDRGDYILITGTDFDNGFINWNTCCFVSEYRYAQDTNIQIKEEDVLITKDGTIGKVAYVTKKPMDGTLNSGIFVIRVKNKKKLYPMFLSYILKSDLFNKFLNEILAGSTIIHLYQHEFVKFKLLFPCYEEQKIIGNFLIKYDSLISLQQKEIENLETIKKSLLQKMFV